MHKKPRLGPAKKSNFKPSPAVHQIELKTILYERSSAPIKKSNYVSDHEVELALQSLHTQPKTEVQEINHIEEQEHESYDVYEGKNKAKEIASLQFELELAQLNRSPFYYICNRQLTKEDFTYALDTYINNQDYYLERNDYESLIGLEHWFIHIIEPRPSENIQEWIARENMKLLGYTFHCCNKAKSYIKLNRKEISIALDDLKISQIIAKIVKK